MRPNIRCQPKDLTSLLLIHVRGSPAIFSARFQRNERPRSTAFFQNINRSSCTKRFDSVRKRAYSQDSNNLGTHIVLSIASLLLTCGNGQAVSNQAPSGNGIDICQDPRYKDGGPAIPAYNYANSGDDWGGACQSGRQQSPIDVPDTDSVALQTIPQNQLIQFGSVGASGSAIVRLEVQEVALVSLDWSTDGFSIPVCGVDDIGCLASSANSTVQYLDPIIANLHFHANSEHTRKGTYYGAEAHLVANISVNDTLHLVVFGIWMDVSGDATNEFFTSLQPYLNETSGAGCTMVPASIKLPVDSLFPKNKEYYAYRGSLTTPPCSEDVTWIVFAHPVKMSVTQLKSLYRANAYTSQPCKSPTANKLCNVLGARTNNRLPQPLNDRAIHLGNPVESY